MSPHRDPAAGRVGRLTARALVAIGVMATGIAAAAAFAQGGPHGRLVQAPGQAGCLHPKAITGCARARAITEPEQVAISPDGRHAYVAGFRSNAVAVFSRNRRTGVLRQLPGKRGCVAHHARRSCRFGRALAAPISVDVSPDGRNVYVAATGSDALSVFTRNRRTGAIRQLTGPRGCISQLPGGGCMDGRALNEPIVVKVSPDGERVYVAARSFPSAVAVLTRGRGGAVRQAPGPEGCVSPEGSGGCTPARGLRTPWDLAVSRDSRFVYVAGSGSDAVAILTRASGGLAQADDASGCFALRGALGCAPARSLDTPTGVALSPDGRSLYVAAVDSDALAIFDRTPATGGLAQPPGRAACVSQAGAGGCKAGRVLDGVHDSVVSPDGRNVYAVSEGIHAISVFARSRGGALSQLAGRWACFLRGGVLGCQRGRGLSVAVSVTMTRDGRHLYVGSADRRRGAVGVYRRLH